MYVIHVVRVFSWDTGIEFGLDKCALSGEASPTFSHANANFSVSKDCIGRNEFLKK